MIREHAFNSAWYGQPVAVIDDDHFFELSPAERRNRLEGFSWAEYRGPVKGARHEELLRSGFFLADVQVRFRIGLRGIGEPEGQGSLEVRRARPMTAGDVSPFRSERFHALPNMTQKMVDDRFVQWAHSLIRHHPETCLELTDNEKIQGWFLAQPEEGGLELTLAMLHREANWSGFTMYQHALHAFHAAGHRIGFASFSVNNPSAHNIYSRLGAHFLEPLGIWFWTGAVASCPASSSTTCP